MLLTAEQILAADDLLAEVVPVPEWGGSVRIVTLSRAEKDDWQDSLTQAKGKKVAVNLKNVTAKLLALCIVDENGKRLFRPDQVEALGAKSALACDRCFQAAARLNGLVERRPG